MSEIEPLYCAEQIKVPPAMPEILKAWTKAVIRENVSQDKLNEWSVAYFAKMREDHERKVKAAKAAVAAEQQQEQ
jgi:hypothetical protein